MAAAAAASPIQQGQNFETYTLIWLDRSANDSRETIQAQAFFRTAINYLRIFQQTDECIKYLQSIPPDDRVVMIVSGRLGQEIVPRIHQSLQVSAIYVYCMNKKNNEQWVQPYNKVKHIIVNLDELVKKIRDEQTERQCNKVYESFPIHFFQSNTPDKQTNNSFLYTHVLIHCLIETNSGLTDKNELIAICREQYEGNKSELKIVQEFEQDYIPSKALWWYTRQSFLYRLLKKALQIQDMKFLLLFRFFIHDIERQLQKTKCTSPIRVYCGKIMYNEDFQILKDRIGGCVIINSFLSTNPKTQILKYFSQIEFSNDNQRVLFEIEANPQLENIKPFSHIKSLNYYPNEDQTLFMLGSIFRVTNLRQEHDGMWTVRIILCSEDDPELKYLFDRNQMKDPFAFGRMFCKLGRFDTAEKYYHQLLKNSPSEHEDMILSYDALGDLEKRKDNYDASLQYFTKALEMRMKIREEDNPDIGDGYNNLGEIYREKHEVKRALEAFDKAIAIYSKTFNIDHPKIAICFNNIGHVYMDDRKYSKALEYFEKTLAIRKKCLPDTHPQIADSLKNIGTAYESLQKFDQALESYNRSLRIYEKSTTPPHFHMGTMLRSIGRMHENKKQYPQAHLHYEKALASFRYVLSATDNHIIQIEQDIQRVSTKLK